MAHKATMPPTSGALEKSHTANTHAENAPTASRKRKTQPKKVEDDGLMASLCTLICNHQIGMPLPQLCNAAATPFRADLNQAFPSTFSLSLS
jgi:hypothetical protein